MMSSFTRRRFCVTGVIGAGFMASGCTTPANGPDQGLPQPEVRTSRNGVLDTTLKVKFAPNDIGGQDIYTRTYEGTVPGPTLRVKPGDVMKIRLVNQLPPNADEGETDDVNYPHQINSTNLHTHGLHVSPEGNSDNVFVIVRPGESFDYEFAIPDNHVGGFFWYHPHKHGAIYQQVRGGMSGALIVEGPLDEVPEIKQARDVVMVLHELELDNQGEVKAIVPDAIVGGDVFPVDQRFITINGRYKPEIHMQSGEVQRWRINNATSNLFMPIHLVDHDMYLIANDGLTLPAPKRVVSQFLSPANRAELLVKAGPPGRYSLRKWEYRPSSSNTEVDQVDLEIATVVIHESAMDMPLPELLPVQTRDIADDEITGHRDVTFDIVVRKGKLPLFQIDGKSFDPERIDQLVKLGAVEEWTVTNTSIADHPFHFHTNPFQVTHIDGKRLPSPVWHDTLNVTQNDGSITFRIRFEDFTGIIVDHCHALAHADFGMMQIVKIEA